MKCCTSTVISTLNYTVLATGALEISLVQFIGLKTQTHSTDKRPYVGANNKM